VQRRDRSKVVRVAALFASVLLVFLFTQFSFAETEPASPSSLNLDVFNKRLLHEIPNAQITSVSASPIDGLYQVAIGDRVYLVDSEAGYIFDGKVAGIAELAVSTSSMSESHQQDTPELEQWRQLSKISEDDMLIYEPQSSSHRSITVFTDISCGYCRRLHSEIEELLAAGIRVRYLLYPRAGVESTAHAKLESVWCSSEPLAAMTKAKLGEAVAPLTCDNPILTHIETAKKIGLLGTPLVYLDNGQRVHGYRPAKDFIEAINATTPIN